MCRVQQYKALILLCLCVCCYYYVVCFNRIETKWNDGNETEEEEGGGDVVDVEIVVVVERTLANGSNSYQQRQPYNSIVVVVFAVAGCLHGCYFFSPLFNIFEEKVQFTAMSPAKARTCNADTERASERRRNVCVCMFWTFRTISMDWQPNSFANFKQTGLLYHFMSWHACRIRISNRFLDDFSQVPSLPSKCANPFFETCLDNFLSSAFTRSLTHSVHSWVEPFLAACCSD